MKRRLISVILFAALAALVSSTIIFRMISGSYPTAAKTATTSVVVAARDLDAGATVAADDVKTMDWPTVEGAPWISQRATVVGRVLSAPVAKGEPFSESRLAAKGSDGGIASKIPPGMRVVAVHVDELTGLSRFLYPGMHVDVISTGPSGNPNVTGVVTRTILQNVEVLSSGDGSGVKEKIASIPVFNLLVTPQQAEILSQAVAQSRIQLVLRNPMDKGSIAADSAPANPIESLIPKTSAKPRIKPKPKAEPAPVVVAVAPPPPPPQPAPILTVEVIQGAKRTVNNVAPASPETKK